jgi:transcriptional regulator with XRE-family HTH domain
VASNAAGNWAADRLYEECGRWLRDLRETRGFSQREFAERVGGDFGLVCSIEAGAGRIPASEYRTWADALGVPQKMFVREMLRCYEPLTFEILFAESSS